MNLQQNTPKNKTWRTELRRRGLKFLALCERARVGIARHPVSPLLYAVILALVVGYVTFNGMYTKAYVVTVDGRELGMVANAGDVESMVANVENRASDILGEEYHYGGDIQLKPAITTSSGLGSTNEMEDTLFANAEKETVVASPEEKAKFARFMESYKAGLAVEKSATERL